MMTKLPRPLAIAALALLSDIAVANSQLHGCYLTQSREPGEWITETAVLLIEKAPNGILLHGSLTSTHSSWISTPENKQPVLLIKSANKYIYQSKVNPEKPNARCELVLHFDNKSIYINKYHEGCARDWHTGNGIGPSEMHFSDKRPNSDLCRSHLGIADADKD